MTTSAVEKEKEGKELHREFVSMLFALAIADVAQQGARLVFSSDTAHLLVPAAAHLILAGMVIATSWVGWGKSAYSLSPVQGVFSIDFIELALDVWLVVVYFFLVEGAEHPPAASPDTLVVSAQPEALWIWVMFGSYVIWDYVSKLHDWDKLMKRIWASVAGFVIAGVSYYMFRDLRDTASVVTADVALLALVMLFRAMKVQDLTSLRQADWVRIFVCFAAWLMPALIARPLAAVLALQP